MLVTNTSTTHQFNFEDLSVQSDEAVVTTFKARVPVEPYICKSQMLLDLLKLFLFEKKKITSKLFGENA